MVAAVVAERVPRESAQLVDLEQVLVAALAPAGVPDRLRRLQGSGALLDRGDPISGLPTASSWSMDSAAAATAVTASSMKTGTGMTGVCT